MLGDYNDSDETERAVYVERDGIRFSIDCIPANIYDGLAEWFFHKAYASLRLWYPDKTRFDYKLVYKEAFGSES